MSLDRSQVSRKQKRAGHGNFNLPFTQIFWEKTATHEKTNLPTIHLQIRLGYRKPHAVHSVTVFCNLKSQVVLMPSPDVSPLIPVPTIGYVQSQSSTAHSITLWLPESTRYMGDSPRRLPCGLADHPDLKRFLRNMNLAENTAGS